MKRWPLLAVLFLFSAVNVVGLLSMATPAAHALSKGTSGGKGRNTTVTVSTTPQALNALGQGGVVNLWNNSTTLVYTCRGHSSTYPCNATTGIPICSTSPCESRFMSRESETVWVVVAAGTQSIVVEYGGF